MLQGKLWAIQVFKLTKTKGNLQQTPLFNTTAVQPSQPSKDWPSLHLDIRQLVQMATVLQPAKADQLLYMYTL